MKEWFGDVEGANEWIGGQQEVGIRLVHLWHPSLVSFVHCIMRNTFIMVLVVQMKGMPELVHVCWVTGGTGYRGTINR